MDYKYGDTTPIPFKLVLNGDGVNPTLATGDVKVIKDSGSAVNVNTLPTADDATNAIGAFSWTPTAAETQAKTVRLVIKDQTNPRTFDENTVILWTGGNAAAYFDGT